MSLKAAAILCAADTLRTELREFFPPVDEMSHLHTTRLGEQVSSWLRENTCDDFWADVGANYEYFEDESEDRARDLAIQDLRRELAVLRPDGWYLFEAERALFIISLQGSKPLSRRKIIQYDNARWTLDMYGVNLHLFDLDPYGASLTELSVAGLATGFRRRSKGKR